MCPTGSIKQHVQVFAFGKVDDTPSAWRKSNDGFGQKPRGGISRTPVAKKIISPNETS